MYKWEIRMSNGNTYHTKSKENTADGYMYEIFGKTFGDNAFGSIVLRDSNKNVLINIKHLSEIIWEI